MQPMAAGPEELCSPCELFSCGEWCQAQEDTPMERTEPPSLVRERVRVLLCLRGHSWLVHTDPAPQDCKGFTLVLEAHAIAVYGFNDKKMWLLSPQGECPIDLLSFSTELGATLGREQLIALFCTFTFLSSLPPLPHLQRYLLLRDFLYCIKHVIPIWPVGSDWLQLKVIPSERNMDTGPLLLLCFALWINSCSAVLLL
ncbi:hypothetical protein Anapl_03351 [Anas platyrhynchos]|uniref:Uncharacterized protein n=1 Tax=Anas platyrhynchos TaxID=8839 RepID=R0LT95_ANAPL|nr:hypothetical protein Anapl_03351 [Anas platyrhynchos]